MANSPRKLEELAAQIKNLSELITSENAADLPGPKARRVRSTITEACGKLQKLIADLDPIKHPGAVFDPSNPVVVGRVVAITLIAQPRKPLANVERFYGSGVYAIYYNGDFKAYRQLARSEHPIYVGKADPADAAAKTVYDQGDRLANRLNDHCRNISKVATTLRLKDFEYRALVVQSGWQTSAEDYLIDLFRPIWNNEIGICYGFGKHGDDPATRANLRSPWDTMHPGRDWAHRDKNMKDAKSEKEIIGEIQNHLREHPAFRSVDQILKRFLEEIRAVS